MKTTMKNNNHVFEVILAAYLWGKITATQFWWFVGAQLLFSAILAVYSGIKSGFAKAHAAQLTNQGRMVP